MQFHKERKSQREKTAVVLETSSFQKRRQQCIAANLTPYTQCLFPFLLCLFTFMLHLSFVLLNIPYNYALPPFILLFLFLISEFLAHFCRISQFLARFEYFLHIFSAFSKFSHTSLFRFVLTCIPYPSDSLSLLRGPQVVHVISSSCLPITM